MPRLAAGWGYGGMSAPDEVPGAPVREQAHAEVSPEQVPGLQRRGALLIDVRDDGERVGGMPRGALGLPLGTLEQRATQLLSEPDRQILVLCASGRRSLLAAGRLRELGCRCVASVSGGFARWQALGLPQESSTVDTDFAERYARQMQLPQIDLAGQKRLAAARVVVVGAGGLGTPVLLYLAAAGVGHLRVIDDDRIERSNLHRQVIHADARVGMGKVESARLSMLALNPRIGIETRSVRLDSDNAADLLSGNDVVVDGADNLRTRYALSAASIRLGIPMIYGAVERFSGQASVFDPREPRSPCYRCLFPEPPTGAAIPSCNEAGVLGVLPGMVGMIQATETIKLLLGIGQPLTGRLLNFDALSMKFFELALSRNPDCPGCGDGRPAAQS